MWWTIIIMACFGFVALNFELWMLPMGLLLGMCGTTSTPFVTGLPCICGLYRPISPHIAPYRPVWLQGVLVFVRVRACVCVCVCVCPHH